MSSTDETRQCLDCGEPITDKPKAKYCPVHRSQRLSAAMKKAGYANRKYVFNERIDDALRQIYATPHGKRKGGVAALARRLGWGHSTLTKRAAELGLASQRMPAWTERELKIVQSSAHLSVGQVVKNLKRAGFHRTETAVIQQRRRFNFTLSNSSYYSASALAECFGTKYQRITNWIRKGLLTAKQQGTALAEYGRDLWLIHHDDVREFVRRNPTEFDLRTVDQIWFLDLVFHGEVGATVSEALRNPEVKQYDEDAA